MMEREDVNEYEHSVILIVVDGTIQIAHAHLAHIG
jgi:hypothetical protein